MYEAESVVIYKRLKKGATLKREVQTIMSKDSKPKTLRDYTDPFYSPVEDILLAPVVPCDRSLNSYTQQEHYYLPAATPVPSNRSPIGKYDPCVNWPKVVLILIFIVVI